MESGENGRRRRRGRERKRERLEANENVNQISHLCYLLAISIPPSLIFPSRSSGVFSLSLYFSFSPFFPHLFSLIYIHSSVDHGLYCVCMQARNHVARHGSIVEAHLPRSSTSGQRRYKIVTAEPPPPPRRLTPRQTIYYKIPLIWGFRSYSPRSSCSGRPRCSPAIQTGNNFVT